MPSRLDEFESLVSRHSRLVASAIRRVCARKFGSLIPDVQQEVYVALWNRLGSGKEIEHPASYVYKVALTTALAVVRKHMPAAEPSRPDVGNGPSYAPAPAFLGLAQAEQSRLLSEALGSLPAEESRAVRAYLAGFNHEELASLYGWSPSVARHRIYRGLEKVRRIVSGEAQ